MDLLPPDDPRLYAPSAAVADIQAQVLPILPGLRIAMAKAPNSVALSAPQVGIFLRVFITSGRLLPSVVINPEVIEQSPEIQKDREGCLTWPGRFTEVGRPQWVRARFFNVKGFQREDVFRGFAARIFMHEFDHLEGRCIFPRPEPAPAPN